MSQVVGVIPAAGYATRLQPLNGSKEVIHVSGRPVIDHLVERMREGGASRIRVVTRPEKQDVVAYARTVGADIVLAHPPTVSKSFVAGIEGLQPRDIVLMGFPDTLWEPVHGYALLAREVEGGAPVALGLFQIPSEDLARSDVVEFDDQYRVSAVHVKPSRPPSEWIWGCAAARAERLSGMGDSEWPGAFFGQLCAEGHELIGVPLSSVWLDIGTQESLQRADKRGK